MRCQSLGRLFNAVLKRKLHFGYCGLPWRLLMNLTEWRMFSSTPVSTLRRITVPGVRCFGSSATSELMLGKFVVFLLFCTQGYGDHNIRPSLRYPTYKTNPATGKRQSQRAEGCTEHAPFSPLGVDVCIPPGFFS